MSSPEAPVAVARLLDEQEAELPQKDDLCGPFWGLVTLRAAGLRSGPDGEQLDQEAVAVAAGSRLSPPPRERSRPPGEPGRDDYRLELPLDADDPGTSAAGLAHALSVLSRGRLEAVPVSGDWQVARLLTLLDSLWGGGPTPPPVAVIANLHTGYLWPAGASAVERRRYLETGRHHGPRSDWSIGHFAALTGLTNGALGTLLSVADTYPSRGQRGRHQQPVERVVAALQADGEARGLLIVVDAGSERRIGELAVAARLHARAWDGLGGDGVGESQA